MDWYSLTLVLLVIILLSSVSGAIWWDERDRRFHERELRRQRKSVDEQKNRQDSGR